MNLAKLAFKLGGEIRYFPNKEHLKKFMTTKKYVFLTTYFKGYPGKKQ